MRDIELGHLIKALDADLAVSALFVAAAYLLSLWSGRDRVRLLGRIMMVGVAGLALVTAEYWGGLGWMFYVRCVDPFASLLPPLFRLQYLALGAATFNALLAVPAAGRFAPAGCDDACLMRWWLGALLVFALGNGLLVAALVAFDAYADPWCAS